LAAGKMHKPKLVTGEAASGMILQNQKRLPVYVFIVKIAVLGSLNKVNESISQKLLSNFKGAS
jgi:hypothetical protein